MPDRPEYGRIVRREDYRPAALLPGPHLPTIWASLFRRGLALDCDSERLELPDGDFVDLVCTGPRDGRAVIVLHGLEGSIESRYAQHILGALAGAGYRAILMQFRGCSGVPNRLDRSYHSGDTGDFDVLVRTLTARDGRPPLAAVGYSVGGNVLLKWLGEQAGRAALATAVAISVPFDLDACATHLDQGFSRIYQRRLVRSMQDRYRRKFATRPAPRDIGDVRAYATFRTFDDAVTAPLHGFRDVDDYYSRASCGQYLAKIRRPTLILHAEDDPFVPAHAIPTAAMLSPACTLELTSRGGHVGFVGSTPDIAARYWVEPRVLAHLREYSRR